MSLPSQPCTVGDSILTLDQLCPVTLSAMMGVLILLHSLPWAVVKCV